MQYTGARPLACRIAGFFTQFTLGAHLDAFARVQFACGELDHHLPQRIAELPLQHQPDGPIGIFEKGDDHHGTRMRHIFTRGQLSIGQFHRVAKCMDKAAFDKLLAGNFFFNEVTVRHHASPVFKSRQSRCLSR